MRRWTILALAAVMAGLSVVASPAATAVIPDFRVGIQLADDRGYSGFGVKRYTQFASLGNSVSEWAGDSNNFDPDAARIELDTTIESLTGLDFRVGGQARDNGSHLGTPEYTNWASAGGGLSELISDDNSFDPDQYRLFLETRPLPAGVQINDIRLSIQAVDDDGAGIRVFTLWASQGGGRSAFAVDPNRFDPDGFRIGLEVR